MLELYSYNIGRKIITVHLCIIVKYKLQFYNSYPLRVCIYCFCFILD